MVEGEMMQHDSKHGLNEFETMTSKDQSSFMSIYVKDVYEKEWYVDQSGGVPRVAKIRTEQ